MGDILAWTVVVAQLAAYRSGTAENELRGITLQLPIVKKQRDHAKIERENSDTVERSRQFVDIPELAIGLTDDCDGDTSQSRVSNHPFPMHNCESIVCPFVQII